MITAGFQIRAARAGLGWSQTELAERAGNQTLLALDRQFAKIDRAFRDMPARVMAIKYDRALTADKKESRIEALYAAKNRVLGDFYRVAETAINEAERKMAK